MEIYFDEILRDYLRHLKDHRSIMKWLEREKVDYFRKPLRCIKSEFLIAFENAQMREIKKQNPFDHNGRIERLKALEVKIITPVSVQILPSSQKSNVIEVLNPAFEKPENLSHLTFSKKDTVPGLFIFCRKCKKKKKQKKCPHSAEEEVYKLRVSTKSLKISFQQEFDTIRNWEEAKSLARELRRIAILNGGKPSSFTIPVQSETKDIQFVSELIDDYLEYQEKNQGIYAKSIKGVSINPV
jgi:hypothetical protein